MLKDTLHLEGEGGCSLIFTYIHSLGQIFRGSKILNFNIFGGFQKSVKSEYVVGYEDFEDISWGHHKTGLFWGVISMHFRVFYCQGTEWEYFWRVDKRGGLTL